MEGLFKYYCFDEEKVLCNLRCIYNVLLREKCIINSKILVDLLGIVHSFEKCEEENLLGNKFYKLEEHLSSDCKTILLSITHVLFTKHVKYILSERVENDDECSNISLLLDTATCLSKLFETEEELVKETFNYISEFFAHYKLQENTHLQSYESSLNNKIYLILKFFSRFLECFPTIQDHETAELIISIVGNLSFSDLSTIKYFANFILPVVLKLSNVSITESIFKVMWDCVQFQYEQSNDARSHNYAIYILVYSITKYISNCPKDLQLFFVQNVLFWDVIQSGLASDAFYIRKITVNIFKTILCWLSNTESISVTVNAKNTTSTLVSTAFPDGLRIWDDIVNIFETLEEKQIHIIKPVLPKFSRIVQLCSPQHGNCLSPSWCMILFRRMLKHESRCVVKWTLDFTFQLSYEDNAILKENSEDFIKLLFEAINDQTLFSRACEQDNFAMFLSSEKISIFLNNYIGAFAQETEKVLFLKSFLHIIASQSWSIAPLLHVISALTKLHSIPAWTIKDIPNIRKIVSDCQRSQEPTFRSVLENMIFKCCCLFLDWSSFNLEDLADLLVIFKNVNHLQNTDTWIDMTFKFKENFMKHSNNYSGAIEFCNVNIKRILDSNCSSSVDFLLIEKICNIFILLNDASIISSNENCNVPNVSWKVILNPVIEVLQNVTKRSYMPITMLLSSLLLIIHLLKKGKNCNKYHVLMSPLMKCLQDCPETMEFIFQVIFSEIKSDNYILKIRIIFIFLDTSVHEPNLKELVFMMVPKIMERCAIVAKDEKLKPTLLIPLWIIANKMYFLSQGNTCCSFPGKSDDLKSLNFSVISQAVHNNLLCDSLTRNSGTKKLDNEENLKFVENSICQFWNTCSDILQYSFCDNLANLLLPLIEKIHLAFDNGPKVAIPCAIECLQFIIPKLRIEDTKIMHDALIGSLKVCLELRGSEAFRPAVCSLIKTVFQKKMFEDQYFDILYEFIDHFGTLSENTFGIFYYVISHFCSTFTIPCLIESKFNYVQLFVQALTYGPTHEKGQKIIEDTLVYITENSSLLPINKEPVCTKPSYFVRVAIINYVLRNIKNVEKSRDDFIFKLISGLLDADNEHYNVRTSRFSNSLSHRMRNRIWQSICLLQPLLTSVDFNEQILDQIFVALENKTHQPSIRYQLEWIIFNILKTENMLIAKYLSFLYKLPEKRPSCIISIVTVLYLLVAHQVLMTEQEIMQCFPSIIIQSMGQNFTVRLYAQMTLIKLFHISKERNFINILNKYEFVLNLSEMHEIQAEQGNFSRNIKKLSEDFYFTVFSPICHFSLETLFFDLPRLVNLPPDEWIKPSLFDEECNKAVRVFNDNSITKGGLQIQWSFKPLEEKTAEENESFDYNFQKKICPLKDFLSFDGDQMSELFIKKQNLMRHGLVVVASLCDRIPNLGGLCRTCEIFGIKEFVIGSLKYVEDKQFQTLAVSSDKWIPIKEVKPYHLKDYLVSMKEQDYVLIGAEQTENSCYLQNFKFPEKSVLLLGHEKEGLPVDLIQLLDYCVEIPQQGVVRSLNVHVSGAILIWEYSRQHLTKIS
ncbi:probable methyltransferase TARBP1 [Parasteatoda tepidariorum]|uniref:probable methyltransferase TARBP1 n=1 Tax=Parasteatoda tepidariorum TaxID=114398 RepID=UPI001C728ED1|nr:probable methyltransferase TARBP1 [Parasteatoda tepidariorum]